MSIDLSPGTPFNSPEVQPTNNLRAMWANDALSTFVNEVGDSGDDETNTLDLLIGLRHLADAQQWDIESLWKRSRRTYRDEISEQPKADDDFAI